MLRKTKKSKIIYNIVKKTSQCRKCGAIVHRVLLKDKNRYIMVCSNSKRAPRYCNK